MSSSATDNRTGQESAIDVVMPQMGVSVAEGTIAGWLKQPGEAIATDEAICEVSTDKIDVEIPAPEAGTLAEVLVAEGETVAVGTVIARIGTATGPVPASNGNGNGHVDLPAPEIDRSRFYSPVVRRIAEEHGGTASASNAGDGGAIVEIRLPLEDS